MNKSLNGLIRWFCRHITFNELASAVAVLLDILSGKNQDFKLKPELESKSVNYRKFTLDGLRALTAPPVPEDNTVKPDWKQLLHDYSLAHQRDLKPVKRRTGSITFSEHCHCEHCGAPGAYLYLNDGCKGNQVRCKICSRLSSTERVRQATKAKYLCPYCGKALFLWKERETETVYKCQNVKCSHYIEHLHNLTRLEVKARRDNVYDPNYKLHYQYREYHFLAEELKCARPLMETKVDLRNIRNSYHTVGLALSLFINIGLSSRQTRETLKGILGIDLSHQTVINYVNASASIIATWLDKTLPEPTSTVAGDETYIIVENQWHYTWFVIDSYSRAICGYNLSDNRGVKPALETLYNTFGSPESNEGKKFTFVRDGLGSYDAAINAYNQKSNCDIIQGQTVVGLENLDEESSKYRPFKQLIERLNRTYKFHTRPRAGFKSLDGAICMTTLFVTYYNFMRKHSANFNSPPVKLDALNGITSYPKLWEKVLKVAAA
jgi:transposase-like protein